MLELGAGADILRALGWLYLGLMVLLIAVALWLPKRWWQKAIGVVAVLLVFVGPAYMRSRERTQLVDEHKARYEAAKAVFDERCKTAGEKIYRTVEDVEGVLLLNVRPGDLSQLNANLHDPNWPDAGMPGEYGGDSYILTFLGWEKQQFPPMRGVIGTNPKGARDWFVVLPGYSYVDVKESDGIYRYRLQQPGRNDLLREPLPSNPARYAVSYRNLVDAADRAHWVAGTVVTITDTSNNQMIAEKTWYSFEPGLGSRAGHRMPWLFSIQCSSHERVRNGLTRLFVDQVLKPKQGDRNVK